MDCTALVSQALAARGHYFHGWPEEYVNVPGGHVVTDGSLQPGRYSDLCHTRWMETVVHTTIMWRCMSATVRRSHGGWNGYSVALASAMTEKLTIVVRIP